MISAVNTEWKMRQSGEPENKQSLVPRFCLKSLFSLYLCKLGGSGRKVDAYSLRGQLMLIGVQKGSTTRQGPISLMPHTKFGSNGLATFGDVFVKC